MKKIFSFRRRVFDNNTENHQYSKNHDSTVIEDLRISINA